MWWPYQGPYVFKSSLPCFLSTDEENASSLCLVAGRGASVFRNRDLPAPDFLAPCISS